jgi:hypothetical protein
MLILYDVNVHFTTVSAGLQKTHALAHFILPVMNECFYLLLSVSVIWTLPHLQIIFSYVHTLASYAVPVDRSYTNTNRWGTLDTLHSKMVSLKKDIWKKWTTPRIGVAWWTSNPTAEKLNTPKWEHSPTN